jgi:hypothetical protein
MLKYGEINPLNVHGMRRLDWQPPHFTPFCFDLRTNEKSISDWVWANLSGRFYYGDHTHVDEQGRKSMSKIVAFEIPAEASYFGLMVDHVNRSDFDLV